MNETRKTQLDHLKEAVELITGKDIEYLRNVPLDEYRKEVESQPREPNILGIELGRFTSGKTGKYGEHIITHEEIESELDKIIEKKVFEQ